MQRRGQEAPVQSQTCNLKPYPSNNTALEVVNFGKLALVNQLLGILAASDANSTASEIAAGCVLLSWA